MDNQLIEKLSDDFFDPLTLTQEELVGGIRRLTVANVATPIFCGSSLQNMAVQPLMDAIVSYLPGPQEKPVHMYVLVPFPLPPSPPSPPLPSLPPLSPSLPSSYLLPLPLPHCIPLHPSRPNSLEDLYAYAFKVTHDKRRGPMVYLRLYSGHIEPHTTMYNLSRHME